MEGAAALYLLPALQYGAGGRLPSPAGSPRFFAPPLLFNLKKKNKKERVVADHSV